MAESRAHLLIRGRVQGVFYRAETARRAEELGLTGWVRNRRDGVVEAVAEGERSQVEELIAWCRKGPALARVSDVAVEWLSATGEFSGFGIAPTA